MKTYKSSIKSNNRLTISSSRCNLANSAFLSLPTPFTINFCSPAFSVVPFLWLFEPQQQFLKHLQQQAKMQERQARNGAQHMAQHLKHLGQLPRQHFEQQFIREKQRDAQVFSSSSSVALFETSFRLVDPKTRRIYKEMFQPVTIVLPKA